jgi:hypothetical protein
MAVLRNWDPLNMPRGSVRALVTLILLITLWVMMFWGSDVSATFSGVVLLILGNYFGSRQSEPGREGKHPLFLPKGSIRLFIILGFAAVAYFTWRDGRMDFDLADQNFAIILTVGALVAGGVVRFAANLISGGEATKPRRWFENVKAIAVIAAACLLALVMLLEIRNPARDHLILVTVPLVSFYFGSR